MQSLKASQVLGVLLFCGPLLGDSLFLNPGGSLKNGLLSNSSGYQALEVIDKSPVELLKLRGFQVEVHFPRTRDGYYINVVRIIHPLLNRSNLKRPVVFNHGLLESATIWLINSRNVKPLRLDLCGEIPQDPLAFNGTFYLNGPMMLANKGYDVYLMSMRGTDYSLRNDFRSPTQKDFWDYSLDDFALGDLPTVFDYIRKRTGAPKIGYIGHSQATFSVFGLLATRPKYADILEPVVAVAPVAYFDHITSIARPLFVGAEELTNDNLNGPFPRSARKIRLLDAALCKKEVPGKICQLIEILIGGAGKRWLKGYFAHLPFYTSLKILRHFGQLVVRKMFARYDHGANENVKRYGQDKPPRYRIERIRSNSLVLIRTRTDALSTPLDVDHFKRELTVPIFREIFIKKDFNHFDLITDDDARQLVFKPILEVLESFEAQRGICALNEVQVADNDKLIADTDLNAIMTSEALVDYPNGNTTSI